MCSLVDHLMRPARIWWQFLRIKWAIHKNEEFHPALDLDSRIIMACSPGQLDRYH